MKVLVRVVAPFAGAWIWCLEVSFFGKEMVGHSLMFVWLVKLGGRMACLLAG